MKPVIFTENLNVGYDKKVVVEQVDICAQKGELICLLGPNGSGKSTILRTLTGLQPPVNGRVEINGRDIATIKKAELAKKMAIVLTEQVSLGLLTVFEIASMGRYPHTNFMGRLSAEDEKIVNEALDLVDAGYLKNRYYFELSDGEKQKVMIARALVQEPELIVLDEPTSHLDVRHKVEVISILRKLCLEKGITVVLSLHDIDIAIKGCQKILLIEKGKVKAQGTPEEIIKTGTIQSLYSIEGANYNELLGCLEFCSPVLPEVFITGGNGTGTGVYRAVSRAGFGMCCGVLHSNDIDLHVAKALNCDVVEEDSFSRITEKHYEDAAAKMAKMHYVIDTGFPVGKTNEHNLDLIIDAIKMGKVVFSLTDQSELKGRFGDWAEKIKCCKNPAEILQIIPPQTGSGC
ncbi:ABC transporter ATP-binding protein [Acetobacterium carbinolicum]|jgi:iron complex transport system ATP-binding protein|uniref:ABC transporter ATP-binding protein n=1 Tax=Acetobacterium TaxID=33951 RepID=UPI000DBECD5B|nr:MULTISPECIES: ABC transporter ATP-binding protein [unclassified Acetobacterium]AWW28037.1 ABC transporter ATP-binding protein [Acetobacterium sp. KB-1]MDZ5726462.1 ABC transporter ATP-binding protein [Acetobacterium sp. K1/6]